VLLVAAYWRTNLTLRQLAPLDGISKSAADPIIDDLGPKVALRPRKNYRYSTNHQVIIDADTQLVVAVGTPFPGNRNDCKAFGESGAEHACRNHDVIGDGGYISPPVRSSRTAAVPARPCRTGRTRTTPPTVRSEPAPSMRSRG
jgi:hypothetical protein